MSGTTLEYYRQMAQNAKSLDESVQRHLLVAAKKFKNPGDRLMADLAARDDLAESLKPIIEKSTRACVLSAWLARKEHTQEYLTDKINNEERITVLKAIASEAADPLLLQLLVNQERPQVAVTLLERVLAAQKATTDMEKEVTAFMLSDDLINQCLLIIVANRDGKKAGYRTKMPGLSWSSSSQIMRLIKTRETLHEKIGETVQDVNVIATVTGYQSGITFKRETLERFALMMKNDWEKMVDASSYYASSAILAAVEALLGQANWDTAGNGDVYLAEILEKTKDTRYYSMRGELSECHLRHFGTAAQKAAAVKAQAKILKETMDAQTASDTKTLKKLVERNEPHITEGLALNPNLRYSHFPKDADLVPLELVERCYLNQGDKVKASVYLLVGLHRSSLLSMSDLTEEEQVEVAEQALEAISRLPDYSRNWRLISILRDADSALATGVAKALSVKDTVALTAGGMLGGDTLKQIMTAAAKVLSENLETDEDWDMFTSLAGELEAPLGKAVRISTKI